MNDDLDTARGILFGVVFGMVVWIILFGIGAMALRWAGWW